MEAGPHRLADAYARLRSDILEVPGAVAECADAPVALSELEVQQLWELGLLGNEGTTQDGRHVSILDFGEWNRAAGPDFLSADIEIDGERKHGAVEIDPCAQDWERHGHGANPRYNEVVLHVVLAPPPSGWYTRNEQHMEVPVLHLSADRVRRALDLTPPPDAELVPLCRAPLADMDSARVESLLRSAAAHRLICKRKRFRRKAAVLGEPQAWYEAWAETLGYSANKVAMQALARRAPLSRLGDAAEAILFGTAGFLVPVLPDKASSMARLYHREVWATWWKHREHFYLAEERGLPWSLSGMRPLNHPHRRVAALAVSALRFDKILPLLNVASGERLCRFLTEMRHPFWDFHYTLNSASTGARSAMVGRERAQDFLVNHVFVQDETPGAWESYLRLGGGQPPSSVRRTARYLFGERDDLAPLLRFHYARQALIQIATDFCAAGPCRSCLFPEQLVQWQ